MNQFTLDELKNISILISKAPITGQEAMTVAMLQQNIAQMIASINPIQVPEVKPESKPKK